MISRELYNVLQLWDKLANSSDPRDAAQTGLCSFIAKHGGASLVGEFEYILRASFVNWNYPFNHEVITYITERSARRCHLNPARRAWVQAQLDEYKEHNHG